MKYIAGRKRKNSDLGIFVFRVPDMYEIFRLGKIKDVSENEVEIKEKDLMRLVRADELRDEEVWISRSDEQQNLDDDTFISISVVQACYYLSLSGVLECKRMNKRKGYPDWMILKRRLKRGGRVLGKCYDAGILSNEDRERISSMIADKDRIVRNMVREGRFEEYLEFCKDVALFEGKKFNRKESLHTYMKMRVQK